MQSNRKEYLKNFPKLRLKRQGFHFASAAGTHVGCRRRGNEDSYLTLTRGNQHLYVVSDGMGGYAGGALASRLVVQEFAFSLLTRLEALGPNQSPAVIDTLLRSSVTAAAEEVAYQATCLPQFEHMGATLTALLMIGDVAYLTHVGDSRAYLIRDEEITQVSEDHSWVQHQVNLNWLSPEDARFHPRRNIILRSISASSLDELIPDIAVIPLQRGDRFLLCSDGLNEHVFDEEMLAITQNKSREGAIRELVALANQRGGSDNSTVVLVEVKGKHGSKRAA
ncbi:MAG: protein phosphatase 2C domain-containing protein [Myxococcota bacterium]|nr:protein phosphatase 2C domain-containing protein [Myxococcota bacterium]